MSRNGIVSQTFKQNLIKAPPGVKGGDIGCPAGTWELLRGDDVKTSKPVCSVIDDSLCRSIKEDVVSVEWKNVNSRGVSTDGEIVCTWSNNFTEEESERLSNTQDTTGSGICTKHDVDTSFHHRDVCPVDKYGTGEAMTKCSKYIAELTVGSNNDYKICSTSTDTKIVKKIDDKMYVYCDADPQPPQMGKFSAYQDCTCMAPWNMDRSDKSRTLDELGNIPAFFKNMFAFEPDDRTSEIGELLADRLTWYLPCYSSSYLKPILLERRKLADVCPQLETFVADQVNKKVITSDQADAFKKRTRCFGNNGGGGGGGGGGGETFWQKYHWLVILGIALVLLIIIMFIV